MTPDVERLLESYGTAAAPHTGRSLRDHLIGTFDLLEAWGNDRDVCLAGLFHSIYGTEVYTHASADLAERSTIGRSSVVVRKSWHICSARAIDAISCQTSRDETRPSFTTALPTAASSWTVALSLPLSRSPLPTSSSSYLTTPTSVAHAMPSGVLAGHRAFPF